MRRCYLVMYDIRQPRRLQRVYKTMKGFGEHWQYSVFFSVLKDIDRVRMQQALEREMNQKEDQVVIVDLGANEDAARQSLTVLGQGIPRADAGIVVV